MRKIVILVCFLMLTISFSQRTFAEDEQKNADTAKTPTVPAHYYHLDIVVQELDADAKPSNSRTYQINISTAPNPASIRTSSRVPLVTGSHQVNGKDVPEFQYQNIGVRVDARDAQEVGRELSFFLIASVDSISSSSDLSARAPIIRSNEWSSSVLIPINKPTVVFTSDSLDSKGSMRVMVTATPLP
ncbi:MAG TPA: hypothetical protein VFE01_01790 [Terracidiphilus sp.]|jgi:hypothetical protein|nr:hypothetical protein [Terracidiphilus sp.]